MAKVKGANYVYVLSPQLKQYAGKPLSVGEVYRLEGMRNDDLLLKHNYIKPYAEGDEPLTCANCDRLFAHASGLSSHLRDSHTPGRREPNALEAESPRLPEEHELIPPQRIDMRRGSPVIPGPPEV